MTKRITCVPGLCASALHYAEQIDDKPRVAAVQRAVRIARQLVRHIRALEKANAAPETIADDLCRAVLPSLEHAAINAAMNAVSVARAGTPREIPREADELPDESSAQDPDFNAPLVLAMTPVDRDPIAWRWDDDDACRLHKFVFDDLYRGEDLLVLLGTPANQAATAYALRRLADVVELGALPAVDNGFELPDRQRRAKGRRA